MTEYKNDYTDIVEAIIFSSLSPIGINKIKSLIDDDISFEFLKDILKKLLCYYQHKDGGFTLIYEDGLYSFQTSKKVQNIMQKIFSDKPRYLSKRSLETLSIIAYKQPINKSKIDFIRGVDSSGTLKTLLERKLISTFQNKKNKSILFKTTDHFLKMFQLISIEDLPKTKEFEILKNSTEVLGHDGA